MTHARATRDHRERRKFWVEFKWDVIVNHQLARELVAFSI